QHLSQLARAVRDYAIFTTDPQGRITHWSQGAERLIGYEPREIIGQHVRLLEATGNAGGVEREMELAARDDRFAHECWRVRKGGGKFWAEEILSPLWREGRALLGFTKVVRDLTIQKEREERLTESAERHRRMIEDVQEHAIFMLDLDGRILTWNRGVEKVLGYREDEFLGQSTEIIFTPEDRASGQMELELRGARETGQARDERWHVRKDGTRFYAHGVLTGLRDSSGALVGFSKVMRDSTERRGVEDALQQTRDDLETRVAERTMKLSETVDLLEAEIVRREQLETALLGAAERERERLGRELHDGVCQHLLGTALLAAVHVRNLTRRGALEASEAERIVELIRDGSEEARNLAKGLHPVSIRSSAGLAAALQELAERTRAALPCRLECPESVCLPPAAALQLFRIAQEAVQNAVKHAEAHGILISLEMKPEHLVLTIVDDGKGWDQEPEESSGMGLLNMEFRARVLRGRLTRDTPPGGGTRVTVSAPLPFASTRP
ncbi:MAG: PAS domain S-box protein, partial [Verrucomicrobiota bacterium]|nr:PAS domain S-box protein [Verrucomicrobiota bacterium]